MIDIKITCQDEYEAQKLASLIFVKKGNETFITEILNVFGNEIVILIKDKSAHSIVLKDEKQVEIFRDLSSSVHNLSLQGISREEIEELRYYLSFP